MNTAYVYVAFNDDGNVEASVDRDEAIERFGDEDYPGPFAVVEILLTLPAIPEFSTKVAVPAKAASVIKAEPQDAVEE